MKKLYEITPPRNDTTDTVTRHRDTICCSACHGEGEVREHNSFSRESKYTTRKCNLCNGSGLLNVKITIEYSPKTNNKNEGK